MAKDGIGLGTFKVELCHYQSIGNFSEIVFTEILFSSLWCGGGWCVCVCGGGLLLLHFLKHRFMI